MIELKDITFSYSDGTRVLNKLNFKLKQDEKIGLIGPNGSGKTTIFKIIMGLLQPDQGDLIIFDKYREIEEDFLEVRERIGYLFQESDNQLFCPTVEEDIAFGPLNLGKTRKEAEQIVRDTLKLVGMSELRKKVIYNLSQGEKKIISFAAVLAMEPEILLLDEPFSSLDEKTKNRMVTILKKIEKPYIIVSHNSDLLANVIDRSFSIKELSR
ncbi:MAG: energy-coupling factor ABC transporter ATP-binding protein [Bacillota bacterium]